MSKAGIAAILAMATGMEYKTKDKKFHPDTNDIKEKQIKRLEAEQQEQLSKRKQRKRRGRR